jgi:hypothetical protein
MGSDISLEWRRLWTRRRSLGDDLLRCFVFCIGAGAHRAAARCYRQNPQRTGLLSNRPATPARWLGDFWSVLTKHCFAARLAALLVALLFAGLCQDLRADKLSFDERMEIQRGLTAEFAKSKILLPRSKKALVFHSNGSYDRNSWDNALREGGPAARLGDEIQITRVVIEESKIVLEINGGTKSGHWYDHVQVGMGGNTSPVSRNQNVQAANGSHIALVFPGSIPPLKSADIRQMLSPIFDFEKHSATEQYMDKLPEPVKKAIKEQRVIDGMDRDQVLLALGKPHNKSRETSRDGDELEDWIYGEPPGKVTFITFNEGKVVKIQESYANIGGTTAPPLPPAR